MTQTRRNLTQPVSAINAVVALEKVATEEEDKMWSWGYLFDFYTKAINYTGTCFSPSKRKSRDHRMPEGRGRAVAQPRMGQDRTGQSATFSEFTQHGSLVLMRFIKIFLDRFFIIN